MPVWKEITAAMVAAFCVSPSNAILDRSVIEYANGKRSIGSGVEDGVRKLFTTPGQFFTSFKFRWMYFVYTLTYATNNLTDTRVLIPSLPLPIQNLILTFMVNTVCGILKDKAYVQHFGVVSPKHFPVKSLGLFFARDLITVASAFTFPPFLAKYLRDRFEMGERSSKTVAQLMCPLLIQIFVTPLHLLGLDLYNREGLVLGERMKQIRSQYPKTLGLRMVRFLPAYGLGGVINNEMRRKLKD